VTADLDDVEYFSYFVSPDCSSCDVANNWEQNALSFFNTDAFSDRTAYYMTGTIFGCLTTHKALKDCSWDYDSYECVMCSLEESDEDLGYHIIRVNDSDLLDYEEEFSETQMWNTLQVGLCGVFPRATYIGDSIPQSRSECFSGMAYKPSIGNDGSHCVCVKPTLSSQHQVEPEDFAAAAAEHSEYLAERDGDVDSGDIDDLYELYQSDFEEGTYRIQKSGTYRIMEDIEFNFNSANDWWPTTEQIDQYPGAGTSRDEYFMGFFAGITVEADDVVIDLNGFEIAQSLAFYHQQRFFSCIALKSVAFPLNQGPGIFGVRPVFASNVVIENGAIGLSSHHGIHGHYNNDVTIENVHVYNFETHGVQMSYFHGLKLKDVEIGPSSNVAFMKGEYAFARWMIQRLERILETDYNSDSFPLRFSGRDRTMSLQDVTDRLQDLVDVAFRSVMGLESYDDDDPLYLEAAALFINDDGIPYGAVMYGLFLNLYYANVFRVHPTLHHADGAEIENLRIHGLRHKMTEYIRMDDWNRSPFMNPWTGSLDARALLGEQIESGTAMNWTEAKYVGSALTDSFIALALATSDWGEKSLLWISDDFIAWSLGLDSWDYTDKVSRPYLGCNNDRMSHAPKGVQGIRMDGVENVAFRNLEIADLVESSPLGTELCGPYWDEDDRSFDGGGHFLTNTPYFYGYTGNRVHGIFTDWASFSFSGEISIHDLHSETGLVRGVGMYTESTLAMDEDAVVGMFRITAGTALSDIDTAGLGHPYAPATAQPFHVLKEWTQNGYEFNSRIVGEPAEASLRCISGRDGLIDSDWTVSVDNSKCGAPALALSAPVQRHDARSRSVSGTLLRMQHSEWLAAAAAIGVLFWLWVRGRAGWRCAEKERPQNEEALPLLDAM